MKRIKKRMAAFVFGAVLGSGFMPAPGAGPALPPDVELPAAATAPEVEARSKLLEEKAAGESRAEVTSNLLAQIEQIQHSELSTIGRERLLFEAAQILGDSGGMDAVPVLRELSHQKPEATFTIPDEREPFTLAYYNFAAMAQVAADEIDYRDAAAKFAIRADEEPRPLLLAALAEEAPARVRGALDALADRPAVWRALADSPKIVSESPRRVLGALIVSAEKQQQTEALLALARSLDGAHARPALLAYGRVRQETGEGPAATLDLIAARPDELGAIALGTLHPADATPAMLARLKDFLNDPGLGADAVAALQRMDDEAARQVALDVLAEPASAVGERRAVLLLMRDGSQPSREARAAYAARPGKTQADEVLKGKVKTWLGN